METTSTNYKDKTIQVFKVKINKTTENPLYNKDIQEEVGKYDQITMKNS